MRLKSGLALQPLPNGQLRPELLQWSYSINLSEVPSYMYTPDDVQCGRHSDFPFFASQYAPATEERYRSQALSSDRNNILKAGGVHGAEHHGLRCGPAHAWAELAFRL